jgi:hypothetical protein
MKFSNYLTKFTSKLNKNRLVFYGMKQVIKKFYEI